MITIITLLWVVISFISAMFIAIEEGMGEALVVFLFWPFFALILAISGAFKVWARILR